MTRATLSRKNLVTLLDTLSNILGGAVRIFAWDSLKSGFIDVRHLPRVPRALALVGLALVFGFLASILFNDPLRFSGTLELLPLSSSTVRGIFVPSVAVPLAFTAVILAWTLLLTSALHIHVVARWGILVGFILFGVPGNFIATAIAASSENESLLLTIIALAALVFIALLVMFLVFPRVKLPVTIEFVLMLAFVGGLFILMLFTAVRATGLGSVDFVSGYIVPEAVTNPRYLTAPLIYLSGAELISFGITFTGWGAQATARFARAWIVTILLGAFLLYRWFGVLTGTILPGIPPAQWLAWGGAGLAIACLIPLTLWRLRHPLGDQVPFKLIVGLILVILAPQLLTLIGVMLVSAFFLTQTSDPNVIQNMDSATRALIGFSNFLRDALYFLLTVTGIVVAAIALRRRRYSVAVFGMILAWTQFVYGFTENGRPLQAWRYSYTDIEMWFLVALTALTLYWAARRTLNTDRTLKLLALAIFAWILRFTDFLDNPLSLFFGLAGVSFTAFGILWGVLTAGGRWGVNSDSPQFPKMSRVLLAIGYVLLTVNVTHWFLVTHNVQERIQGDDWTQAGLKIFGYTAAFLIFVEGGRALLQQDR